MTNPRKFSEKIAIHQQKQAEGTAAFDEIMREVNRSRGKDNGVAAAPFMKMRARYRGGSLPNIASGNMHVPQNQLDLQNALENLQEMQTGRPHLVDNRYNNRRMNFAATRPMPMARSRVETAPYHARLLSPAHQVEQSWRRTNSDSAIHQSLQQRPHQLTQQSPLQHQQMQRKQPAAEGIQSSPPKSLIATLQQNSKRTDPALFQSHRSMDAGGQSYMQMQASSGSLPDLSSINLQSSPQNPNETEDANGPSQSQFTMPLHAAPRRHYAPQSCGKQVFPGWQYPLPTDASARDKMQHRLQLYATLGLDHKGTIDPPPAYTPDQVQGNGPPQPIMLSSSSPASPVNSYQWGAPMSPLATEAFTQQNPLASAELQQQFQQFQVADPLQMPAEIPYYMQHNPSDPNAALFDMHKYKAGKGNNGLPDIILPGSDDTARGDFARQLGQAMDVGSASGMTPDGNGKAGVSEDAFDSVRGGLDPLNFDDVQLLSDANSAVVDQSTENQFRLEHASNSFH